MTVEGSAPVVWNILIDSIISLLSDCRPNWLSAVSLLPPTPNVDISPSLTTSHRPLLTISRPFHPSSSRPRPAAHQHQGTGYKVRPGEGRVQSESDARKVQTFCSSLQVTSDHKHGHGGDPSPEAVRGGAANSQTGGRDREDQTEKVSSLKK